jgi:hypothetical protein
MVPVNTRNIADAPKDLLRYGSRFLEFPEIVRCREVCKAWKNVIDDQEHDNELFSKFTAGEKLGNKRPFYEAAKVAYLNEIAVRPPLYQRMDYHAPAVPVHHNNQKKCCHNCCGCSSEKMFIIAAVICTILTCCCCCSCCCCDGRLPML